MLFSSVCRKVIGSSRYTHIIGKKYARLVDTRFYNPIGGFFRNNHQPCTLVQIAHLPEERTSQRNRRFLDQGSEVILHARKTGLQVHLRDLVGSV